MEKPHTLSNRNLFTFQDNRTLKKALKIVIYFWALCDIIFVISYFTGWFSYGEIPIYSSLIATVDLFKTSSDSVEIFSTVLLLILETSIYFSAYFLIKQNKVAAYICYLQAPVRIFICYCSVPMVHKMMWVSGNINSEIITIIELIKVISIFTWHTYIFNNENISSSIKRYIRYLFRTNSILIAIVVIEILKPLIEILFYDGEKAFGLLVASAINIVLVYFAFKKNTIAMSLLCISLILLHSLSAIWLLINSNNFNIFFCLFELMAFYFISAGIVLTRRMKTNRVNPTNG